MSELLAALQQVLPADRILTRAVDRIAYASDASFYRLIPRAVVRPASIEDVRALFALCGRLNVPLTFRAAGTSLSGQAISDGILADVSRHWRDVRVEGDGARVRVQPGVIGARVNVALRPFGRRMGPDPASINACMMGGILANSSSGMCCGVRDNAYHTLEALRFVLSDGSVWDSARDAERFARTEQARRLLDLRDRVRADDRLVALIRRKYAIKNTMGYGLNAFLDFDDPLQMLAHLLIGSEGTLGFIAEAVLRTVEDPPLRLTGLFLFASVADACAAIAPLSSAGAAALELMDRASLASVEDQPGIPAAVKGVPDGASALLVEFQAALPAELDALGERMRAVGQALPLISPPLMASDDRAREALWRIRKGLFPSVGATREPGTTVIIEDVAVPVERLGAAVGALQGLFVKHGYPGGIVFGHARDGNLHFVIAQSFNDEAAIAQYADFIEDVVEMITSHAGSLKAEHGTGRNMAPFVEREWGRAATSVMRDLKALLDPMGFLNPGVLITDDERAHVRHLKDCPRVAPEVDRCIECGFCEPKCPSRDLTMTPRQRIVAMREVARGGEMGEAVWREYAYPGVETCAADGMCATACPVSIDTGRLVKRLRVSGRVGEAGAFAVPPPEGQGLLVTLEPASCARQRIAVLVARHFGRVERLARAALFVGHAARSLLGESGINATIGFVERIARTRLPRWLDPMPLPARPVPAVRADDDPDYVYFPTCISRMMGPPGRREPSVPELLLRLSARAEVSLAVARPLEGTCCGMPFSSKGFPQAGEAILQRTVDVLWRVSNGGARPVVVDNSSCTCTLRDRLAGLDPPLRVMDAVEYAHDVLLPRLSVRPTYARVAVHPVCSLVKMGLDEKLLAVVRACARQADVPEGAGCCGTAGDRGLMYPELTAAATRAEAAALAQGGYDAFVSSNRMCEVGLSHATGAAFTSFLTLLDTSSRPPDRIEPVGETIR